MDENYIIPPPSGTMSYDEATGTMWYTDGTDKVQISASIKIEAKYICYSYFKDFHGDINKIRIMFDFLACHGFGQYKTAETMIMYSLDITHEDLILNVRGSNIDWIYVAKASVSDLTSQKILEMRNAGIKFDI